MVSLSAWQRQNKSHQFDSDLMHLWIPNNFVLIRNPLLVFGHPSSRIRADVALKTCLLADSYERLALDSSIEVVQRIIGNSVALASISTETLKTMIGRDISIANELVSWGLDEMDPKRRRILITELLKYDDPIILDAISGLYD